MKLKMVYKYREYKKVWIKEANFFANEERKEKIERKHKAVWIEKIEIKKE